jgi:hypothetical protein
MNDLIVLLQAAPEAFRARSVLLAARQTVNGNHKQQDPSPYAAHSVENRSPQDDFDLRLCGA